MESENKDSSKEQPNSESSESESKEVLRKKWSERPKEPTQNPINVGAFGPDFPGIGSFIKGAVGYYPQDTSLSTSETSGHITPSIPPNNQSLFRRLKRLIGR